ncbi:hypothetical protein OIU91_05790 [Streptomyces sp. NBC_01456]|uniref:hypothetical protein n=1 Tax=unclassified Streptomyces TaxID=2593676 RepID=UPI002E3301AB|nr:MULTISPECIES: hypothetical protein [unclassified Streptomyces]
MPEQGPIDDPVKARQLAAALNRAADEADWAAGVNTHPRVAYRDLRVGDILAPHTDYRGDDESEAAICVSVKRVGTMVKPTWQAIATGETWTFMNHEECELTLMRRGPATEQ